MSAASGNRLSPLRVAVVLAILGGLVALGIVAWGRGRDAVDQLTAPASDTWFGPYADVTLEPSFAFEDPGSNAASTTVLGFVVPDPRAPCTPTWGTQYDLPGAESELDLDRRIARVRERGGDVVVSFGGAAGSELAVTCTDQASLTQAYHTVIGRYRAGTIDLDIEGAALADAAAGARRAAAIRTLQQATSSQRPLQVWLTLPATPQGLTAEGVAAVDGMLAAGVDLTGVNLMTMDFGAGRRAGQTMGQAARAALGAAHAQIGAAFRRAGRPLAPDQIWGRLGATAMIGRNDVQGEVFTLADAAGLAAFAERVHLRRVSIWSANRDAQCGALDRGGWQVLPTCSGVAQAPQQFARAFIGRLGDSARAGAAPPGPAVSRDAGRTGDDPQASPYPVWRADRAYTDGEKVVWQRTVYEAKWWTEGDVPDAPAEQPWDTPWRNVGPVLASDARAAAAPAEAPPRWSADVVYLRGDQVRDAGYLYEARWRTQAEQPQLDPDRPAAAAWVVIGRAPLDVPPVFETYPAWSATASYAFRDRVQLGAYVYESRRAVRGVRPDPAPAQPGRAAWKVVGTVAPS